MNWIASAPLTLQWIHGNSTIIPCITQLPLAKLLQIHSIRKIWDAPDCSSAENARFDGRSHCRNMSKTCISNRIQNAPSDYVEGYGRARKINREIADNYIAHTHLGDPVVDALVDELASFPRSQVHEFINAGMSEDRAGMRNAPQSLRDFFIDAPQPDPDWLDRETFFEGVCAFQKNAVLILSAFVAGVLINGFATLISKSFVQTGRIFDNGVWRLRQNNRHQLEMFLPGGMERSGDGWKLSVRIRFVHAQVRRLLAQSDEWDHEAWGTPISSAHLGYAVAVFAAHSIKYSKLLGARYSTEEQSGFHDVWRYAGFLMGIPGTILFTDESHALELIQIGSICEPPPTMEAIIMSNALINSAPLVANIKDPDERDRLVNKLIYPIARGLVGDELSDQLNFPGKGRLLFPLLAYRLDQRVKNLKQRLGFAGASDFSQLLQASAYDDAGLQYLLPDHGHAERSSKW